MEFRKIQDAVFGGIIGGLANSLAVWASGAAGISQALGFSIAPELTITWLLPRLFWGGVWGLIFLLPIMHDRKALRGLVLSIAPSIVMLVVIFPRMGMGMFGMGAGWSSPLFVLVFNAIWGVTAERVFRFFSEMRARVDS